MRKKKRKYGHEHYLRHDKDGDISELSARLAPLEELDKETARQHRLKQKDDTIVIDTGSLQLPKNMMEQEREENGILGLEPIVLAILILALAFVAFIAYLVYQMPAPVTK
jgi:hypothetical protein